MSGIRVEVIVPAVCRGDVVRPEDVTQVVTRRNNLGECGGASQMYEGQLESVIEDVPC